MVGLGRDGGVRSPIRCLFVGDNGLLLYFIGQKRNIPVYIK